MAKYQPTPCEVEAKVVPTRDDLEQWGRLAVWLGVGGPWEMSDAMGVTVFGDSGQLHAAPGDYIVRGPRGELLPVAKSVFETLFETA